MKFKSQYTITDKILNNISQIIAGREIIEHSRLIPRWELTLRKEAKLHNAHSSTSIEGNKLTLEQVKALSEKKEITASTKDKQEVANYLQALDSIPQYAKKKVDVKLFLRIHKTLTKGTMREEKDCGVFRNRQVFVGKRIFDGMQLKEVVEYMPPDTKEVPGLAEEFLSWLNSNEVEKINPVILAGIVHYEIARIHPFIDGNGRTARLLAGLILYKSGFDHRRFFALDDYYDKDRSLYYAALKTAQHPNLSDSLVRASAQQNKGDITKWLEYFTDGALDSINKVKETIVKLGFFSKARGTDKIELTPRQVEILEKIKESGKITNKDLRPMLNISRQAILKEISKLVEAGIIKLMGKGRGAYYVATK